MREKGGRGGAGSHASSSWLSLSVFTSSRACFGVGQPGVRVALQELPVVQTMTDRCSGFRVRARDVLAAGWVDAVGELAAVDDDEGLVVPEEGSTAVELTSEMALSSVATLINTAVRATH